MNDEELKIRDEAGLILGFRLPDDPLKWEPLIKSHTHGDIDANKKWNLTIMLLMRVHQIEKKLAQLDEPLFTQPGKNT